MSALLNDVVINKTAGGLGRRTPDQDMVSGLLFDGDETSGLTYGNIARLSSVEDAEALGIDETYDRNGQSAYYQVSQYFRMNPSGDLYVMVVEADSFANTAAFAKEMQEKADGNIRQIGVIYSGAADFAATQAAAQAAQTQADEAFAEYIPFEVIVEGKGFIASNAAEAANLADLGAENVSVVVAMDPDMATKERLFLSSGESYTLPAGATLVEIGINSGDFTVRDKDDNPITDQVGEPITIRKDVYNNTAAVGTLLGTISAAKVSENVAWVEKFNLAGEGFGKPGFIDGEQVTTLGDLSTLNEKKYIFTRTHTGIAGLYFNDSHTCTDPTSDFTYVEANRTINKASRLVRATLLPKLNSPVLVDPEDGTLPPSVVKGFETLCRAALERMVANEEASEIDVYVNPLQDILATSRLDVKVEIVPMGTARRIVVDLGFNNPFGVNLA